MMHEYISADGLRSTVWNMDCMEFMRGKPDGYYELGLVDPPYGIGDEISKGGGSHTKSTAKFHQMYSENNKNWDIIPNEKYFDELMRVSKNQIIWGGNYFGYLPPCRGFICWDKVRYVPNFSMVEFAWTSFDTPAKLFRYCNNAGFILKPMDKKIHPTQKPTALYDWIYRNYLPNGGKVLDTHLGSQSNRISAFKRGNIIFDSTELDADYFATGNARFDAFTAKYEPATHISADATGQTKIF